MRIIDEIKRTATGKAIISEWLGEGGLPVRQRLAELRADTCLICPNNVELGWWDRIKNAIADAMRMMLEVKNRMDLRLPFEDKLGVCRICGCCNQLAPWVPIRHIRHHTTTEQLNAYPETCWKKIALTNIDK